MQLRNTGVYYLSSFKDVIHFLTNKMYKQIKTGKYWKLWLLQNLDDGSNSNSNFIC